MTVLATATAAMPSMLPQTLSIFPLSGVVLLPHARLPLNIFEPRYLAMVEDALGSGRLIGMVQPTGPQTPPTIPQPVYSTGCAGRITSFTETDDGRFLIALTGLCRFTIANERAADGAWRRVAPDWSAFLNDLAPPAEGVIDRLRLLQALQPYFKEEGISLDRSVIENAPDDVLVSSLVMICPLEPSEKQALLEAADLPARAELLTALLEMACMPGGEGDGGVRH
ncbi:MAG: LON peptidase substrate-binding domain-containing protein [Pseudomonadota bacterium]|nr:LON peptidase substrate-binding domain-containing protein [Pseudomonadota bacterium]